MPSRDVLDDWEEIAAEFGHRVRTFREERGLSQEQLGHASGMSRNQIQNIERSRNNNRDDDGKRIGGTANPGLDTIWALARALDVSVGDLVDPAGDGG